MGQTDSSTSRSMTGFGREVVEGEGVALEVEIRSVNSRYLDLSFRLPKSYQRFEPMLREVVAEKLSRGRVEVTINRTVTSAEYSVRFDSTLAEEYLRLGKEFLAQKGLWTSEIEREFAQQVCLRREVLDRDEESLDEEKEQILLRKSVEQCVAKLVAMRIVEGKALAQDIQERFDSVKINAESIGKRIKEKESILGSRLKEKMEKVLKEHALDEQRLALEVALLIEKSDISEELTRIESHLSQVEDVFQRHPHGRKIEFLLQELGREFNTVASKAQDAQISQIVIDVKASLEKIKEQIQNVE